jgi:hypothetical protein
VSEIFFPKIDKDTERRLALAKVYSLLLRLAEEAENKSTVSDQQIAEEKKDVVSQEKSIEQL